MLTIRKMQKEDLEAVYALECACFSVPWSFESLSKEMDQPLATYVVAMENDQCIGYGGMWRILDEGEITNIAVDERFRGKGIGSQILEKLYQEGTEQGLVSITLEVRVSNHAAKKLYEKYGFKEIAIRKNYYQKPTEDALIMQYVFKEE